MVLVLLQLLTGLANAMALFLVASGLSLIFGTSRILNFAHGAFFMLGAYLSSTLVSMLPPHPLAFWAGVLLASVAVAALGGVVERCLLRRVYGAPELSQLLLTFAVVLLIGDLVRLLWGSENRAGPSPPGLSGSLPLWGQQIPAYDLVLLGLGPAVALGLWGLLTRTRWGLLVRAATADREMAAALGVDQGRLFTGVFVLGSWLAGLAGGLQMPRQALTTVMDMSMIAEAFVVVVIGGMGSVAGAWLGAVLIGILQAFGILLLPREFQFAVVFLLMAVVLVCRPWGLLGAPEPAARLGGARAAAPAPAPGQRDRPGPWVWAAGGAVVLAGPVLLPGYVLWLLTEAMAVAVFAGSLQLLVGLGGMLSFGHAAYFGLGAYGAALLLKHAGLSMAGAFLLAPVVAALAAAGFGVFCVRRSGVYFAMLTLACAQIVHSVAHQWYDVTGGDNGILGVWPDPRLASPPRYYLWALAATLAAFALLHWAARAPFGLTLRAARDHPRRAEALGVSVAAQQLWAFVVAGAVAGLAGALFVFLKGSIFPESLAIPRSVEGLIVLMLGGVHRLGGAVAGAMLYTLLDAVITRYTVYWQAVLGSILVLLVLLFPRGVLSVLERAPRGAARATAAGTGGAGEREERRG
jgi:branched-chain amino acid transport system permease protein